MPQTVSVSCRLVRGGYNFGFEVRCTFTVWARALSESLGMAGPEFSS